jgi:hypothetical protein
MARSSAPPEEDVARRGTLPSVSKLPLLTHVQGQERVRAIFEMLRGVARNVRDAKSQPFYSIRSAARHFDIPPASVARMYVRLRKEGLLSCVWGAATRVEPSQLNRELSVRGCVALLISTTRLTLLPDYTRLVEALLEQLQGAGFAPQPIFYNEPEACDPEFSARVLRHCPDAVIWAFPPSAARGNLARFCDRGMKVLTIAADGPAFAGTVCRVSRKQALTRCAKAWLRANVQQVTIVLGDDSGCDSGVAEAQHAIVASGAQFARVQLQRLADLQTSSWPILARVAVIFSSSLTAARLAAESPGLARTVFRSAETLLLDGDFNLPFGYCPETVDVLSFDASALARRLVCGILAGHNPTAPELTIEARWLRHGQRGGERRYLRPAI